MEYRNDIDAIYQQLAQRKLRVAIDAIESLGYKYPETRLLQGVEQLRSNYDLMANYWQRGFKDASLDTVYGNLIAQAYRLAANAELSCALGKDIFAGSVSKQARSAGRDDTFLATAVGELENFVSEQAVIGLEPEHTRRPHNEALQAKHQRYVSSLFDYVWTSGQWADGMVEPFAQLLLSPTVDNMDQQLLVSAVMLGAINIFDINKLRLLVKVYEESTDEHVRQRALVGVVFALWSSNVDIFPEVKGIVESMLADELTADELTELQIQMLYCTTAEEDTRTIQREIMPDIIKNNNLHITQEGIEEREDDPMEDILDSEASERRMEKLEEGIRKMIDMQKAGADIYFGGFSQMKRFSFFDKVSNWFMPFYRDHPDITALGMKKGDRDIIDNLIGHVPFCNSDKYSFVIAFKNVVDRLPQALREMLSNGNATMIGEKVTSEADSPAYIRRLYLQDLYRFFRLFRWKASFRNPFDDGEGRPGFVFFANPIFCSTRLESHSLEIVSFIMKRKLYGEALEVMANSSAKARDDYQWLMVCGNMLLRHRALATMHGFASLEACDCFERALRVKPDDHKALLGYAKAMFSAGNFQEAARAYAKLMELRPESRSHVLGYCVCLANLGRYDEALPYLYKLDYESPDDAVKRVLARTLVGCAKYEQALKLYDGLGAEAEDIVNRGYCEWFMGSVEKAVAHFAQYISMRYPDENTESKRRHCQADIVDSERLFILDHGISITETHLMVDAIRDAIVR